MALFFLVTLSKPSTCGPSSDKYINRVKDGVFNEALQSFLMRFMHENPLSQQAVLMGMIRYSSIKVTKPGNLLLVFGVLTMSERSVHKPGKGICLVPNKLTQQGFYSKH